MLWACFHLSDMPHITLASNQQLQQLGFNLDLPSGWRSIFSHPIMPCWSATVTFNQLFMGRHAYYRPTEDVPPKLTSCAVVQEGACVCLGQSISHLYCSPMSGNRLAGHVKDNDVRYSLKVAHRDPKSSKVTGLQCRCCIAFSREEKVGSKRKVATTVQGAIPSITIILKTIFATNTLDNALYTRFLNPLLSTLHSSTTFPLCSRTHAKVMHAKHILFITKF